MKLKIKSVLLIFYISAGFAFNTAIAAEDARIADLRKNASVKNYSFPNDILKKIEKAEKGEEISGLDYYYIGQLYEKEYNIRIGWKIIEILKPDIKNAIKWYKKGSEFDKYNYICDSQLSKIYSRGADVPQNKTLGFSYFVKAYRIEDFTSFDEIKLKSDNGDDRAQYLMGDMLLYGYVADQDEKAGVAMLSKAAAQKNTDAILSLASLYRYGEGAIKKNPEESKKMYLEAANLGQVDAQTTLMMNYLDRGSENGWEPDIKKAIYWLKKAANQNDITCMQWLADNELYFAAENKDVQIVDDAESLVWCRKLAESKINEYLSKHGVAEYQFKLAERLAQGKGISKDPIEAATWYKKAAENGNIGAKKALADCYFKGIGIPKDNAEGIKILIMIAEKDGPKALSNLAYLLHKGETVPQDIPQAIKLWQIAADKGEDMAQSNLGLMHEQGNGVQKDEIEAVKLYLKSAVSGNMYGQYNLGRMYAAGTGTPKDEAAAANWYKSAAEKGNVAAQNALGLMYAEGRGVIKDAVEAHAWLNLAGASGNEKARERLILLEAKMTPEQISEATKLAKQRFDLLRSSISNK